MSFYLYDWREETVNWPFMARHVQLELILCQWDQPLPKDERALANRCGLPLAEFRPWWREYVKATFKLSPDGHWYHPKTAELRARVETVYDSKKGAADTRWGKQRQRNGPRHAADVIASSALFGKGS
jgi:hypothetical protein